MPEVSAFLTSAKTLISALSVLAGGVFVKLYNTYLKRDQQGHTQAMDIVEVLREDMTSLQNRQDQVERELQESRRKEMLLTGQVQLLIQRIDDLLSRLVDAGVDVTEDERDEYTSIPDFRNNFD